MFLLQNGSYIEVCLIMIMCKAYIETYAIDLATVQSNSKIRIYSSSTLVCEYITLREIFIAINLNF